MAQWKRDAWAIRKRDCFFWQLSQRAAIRNEIHEEATQRAAEAHQRATVAFCQAQARADAHWQSLVQGQPEAVEAALTAAFVQPPLQGTVVHTDGFAGVLALQLPDAEVLPAKKAHVTPSGQLSCKAWTKTELNDVYADLLSAYLSGAVLTAWAATPSLTRIRVVGIRNGRQAEPDVLFDVDVDRADVSWSSHQRARWELDNAQWGLNRVGRTREIRPWSQGQSRLDLEPPPRSQEPLRSSMRAEARTELPITTGAVEPNTNVGATGLEDGQFLAAQSAPANWYQDPSDATQWRWWDGQAWTANRAPR